MKNIHSLPLILLICFIGIEIFTINYFYSDFKNKEKQSRNLYLEQNLDKVVKILERELDKMSILVAGFKSHLNQSDKEPDKIQIRSFINDQLNYLDYSENIIINYIDTNHNFIYSIGTQHKNVNDLAGTNVSDLRKTEVINKLNSLLQSDQVLAFPPLNLYEGHVGLPIDFRYKMKNKVKGYFAMIFDIRNLLSPISQSDLNNEFSFRFTAGNEKIEFDKEKVYDGSKSYNTKIDNENLHRNVEDYTYQNLKILGLPISIGISYTDESSVARFSDFIQSILGILMLFLIATSLLLYLFYQNVQKTKLQNEINIELSKSNGLLKKFIFASSHDLKQPLVNISNFQNLLLKKYSDNLNDSAIKFLDIIRDNIDHMTNILNDLMIYSGIIQKNQNKENVNVEEVLELIIMPYDKDKIKFNLNNILPCYGIKSEISRCFQNLISNSIKYNENEIVEITITGKETKKYIIYEISDNGIGIKKEHQEIIFSEFQRLHKDKFKGTGLGLSICKEIVYNHGGSIRVKRRPGGGTIMSFSISKYQKDD